MLILAAALAALVDIEKELLERRPLLDQALLVRVADQGVEHLAVFLREPVFPRIRTENALLLLPGVAIPGERHDARIRHALHGDGLGFIESPEQVDGEPGMLLRQRLPDAEHMHDRENAGALEIGHLLGLVIGKQPRHARVPGDKRLDEIGVEDRIELAFGQHGLDRFVVRQAGIFDVGRQSRL